MTRHARHIGEIAWRWNMLHEYIFVLFNMVVRTRDPDNGKIVHGIWHTIQSDSTQRLMLEEAAKGRFGPQMEFPSMKMVQPAAHKRALDSILWVTSSAGKLAQFRNDTMHAPIVARGGVRPDNSVFVELIPSASGRRPSVKRLRETPAEKTWRRVCGDLLALATYASYVAAALEWFPNAAPFPWPRRPRLRSVPS
jgi:hypothetical protein